MARVFGHPTRTLAAVLGVLLGTVCVKAQGISLLYNQPMLVVDHTKVFQRALPRDADTRQWPHQRVGANGLHERTPAAADSGQWRADPQHGGSSLVLGLESEGTRNQVRASL